MEWEGPEALEKIIHTDETHTNPMKSKTSARKRQPLSIKKEEGIGDLHDSNEPATPPPKLETEDESEAEGSADDYVDEHANKRLKSISGRVSCITFVSCPVHSQLPLRLSWLIACRHARDECPCHLMNLESSLTSMALTKDVIVVLRNGSIPAPHQRLRLSAETLPQHLPLSRRREPLTTDLVARMPSVSTAWAS